MVYDTHTHSQRGVPDQSLGNKHAHTRKRMARIHNDACWPRRPLLVTDCTTICCFRILNLTVGQWVVLGTGIVNTSWFQGKVKIQSHDPLLSPTWTNLPYSGEQNPIRVLWPLGMEWKIMSQVLKQERLSVSLSLFATSHQTAAHSLLHHVCLFYCSCCIVSLLSTAYLIHTHTINPQTVPTCSSV